MNQTNRLYFYKYKIDTYGKSLRNENKSYLLNQKIKRYKEEDISKVNISKNVFKGKIFGKINNMIKKLDNKIDNNII